MACRVSAALLCKGSSLPVTVFADSSTRRRPSLARRDLGEATVADPAVLFFVPVGWRRRGCSLVASSFGALGVEEAGALAPLAALGPPGRSSCAAIGRLVAAQEVARSSRGRLDLERGGDASWLWVTAATAVLRSAVAAVAHAVEGLATT